MTLDDLIETLTEIRDQSSGDRPVIVATQPSYPLALNLAGVADGIDLISPCRGDEDDEDVLAEDEQPVWLAVSDSHSIDHGPYAPRSIWDIAR